MLLSPLRGFFNRHTYAGPLLALVFAIAFFASQSPHFLSVQNFSLIFQQSMVLGVIAIGQTLVILSAGIDLSCGMAMVLGSLVMSKLASEQGISPALAVALGIGASTLVGMLNGALVTKIRLPSFIVTLGMMNILFALNQLYSNSQTVSNLPPFLTFLGERMVFAQGYIVYGVFVFLFLFIVVALALHYTAPGRHLYALGNNVEAVRLAGISTHKMFIGIYGLAGFFYGIAALLAVARTGVGDPQAGQTENLDSITAVVLGGTSLFGGRGSLVGTLIGILIIGCMRNGLILMGVPSVMQILITGILVILAVTLDSFRLAR